MKKKGLLGIWRTIYIRMWKYALYLCSTKDILENEAKLIELEKKLRETGKSKDKKTGMIIIPMNVVSKFQWKKGGQVSIMLSGGNTHKDEMILKVMSKNLYDAVKICENLTKHLETYRNGVKNHCVG